MLKNEYSDTFTQSKYETLTYEPGLQDSGDLEASTKTINAPAEASGTANADYHASLTLPKPDDVRLAVKRICARFEVVIDSIASGDIALYCRVYVDVQDAAHRLFDMEWTAAGDKLTAVDTTKDELPAIYDLLRDGAAHTFYFFFWKTGSGEGITISTVRVWEGLGSHIVGAGTPCLDIIHTGFLSGFMACGVAGSGSAMLRLCQGIQDETYLWYVVSAGIETAIPFTMGENLGIAANSTINTDLIHLIRIILIIK